MPPGRTYAHNKTLNLEVDKAKTIASLPDTTPQSSALLTITKGQLDDGDDTSIRKSGQTKTDAKALEQIIGRSDETKDQAARQEMPETKSEDKTIACQENAARREAVQSYTFGCRFKAD